MELIKLIADGMQFLIELPIRLLRGVGRWRLFRTLTARGVTDIKGELVPPSAATRFLRRAGRVLAILVVAGLFVGVLAGLWYINRALDLERLLGGPWPAARHAWLPLLFLLFCALCFLGWWLWKLLGPERETAEFPDILEAWEEARSALDQAGIGLRDVPVFLVLGRPLGNVEALFDASRLPFLVRRVPRRTGAPLQVYANRDAIYVACPGASLLAHQVSVWNGELDVAGAAVEVSSRAEFALSADGDTGTPTEAPAKIIPVGADSGAALLTDTEAVAAPSATALLEEAPQSSVQEAAYRRERPSNPQELQTLRDRLLYLCRLIARDRRPYCAANGALVLLPIRSIESQANASHAATSASLDLAVAREGLQTNFPVFAVLCDLQEMRGLSAFLEHFSEDRRRQLLGQDFPLFPNLAPGEVPEMIHSGISWVCEALGHMLYRTLRLEEAEHLLPSTVAANTDLYRLVALLQSRREQVCALLTHLLSNSGNDRLLLGGCYFAATGLDRTHDQAFVTAIFHRLLENQNYVSWTDAALREEADYGRWTTYGYFTLGIFTLAVLTVLYLRWHGS